MADIQDQFKPMENESVDRMIEILLHLVATSSFFKLKDKGPPNEITPTGKTRDQIIDGIMEFCLEANVDIPDEQMQSIQVSFSSSEMAQLRLVIQFETKHMDTGFVIDDEDLQQAADSFLTSPNNPPELREKIAQISAAEIIVGMPGVSFSLKL